MYKVFVNERPLFLTSEPEYAGKVNCFKMKGKDIIRAIQSLEAEKYDEAYVYHPKGKRLVEKFSAVIPLVTAGGGLVRNQKGKVLFIYRNDKWDLPKGKLDKGETIEECAIREVEEETGVKDLRIEHLLKTTYHIFKRNGNYKLK
ncbi:MAG: NUDIX hydrolase, partial [Flavobacteriaceae bacterium]